MRRRSRIGLLMAPVLLGTGAAPTLAADAGSYHAHSPRIVVPYPPGGPTDVAARILGQELGKRLGQVFVIDNKPGAGGMSGAAEVARAAPDGYTLLVNASAHIIYPAIFKNVPFDVLKDFAPVSQLVSVPLLLVVSPNTPAKDERELIAYGRANPGKLTFASAGNGGAPHLAGVLFSQMAGIQATHIPYKGSAPALNDLMGGQVNFMLDSMSSSMAHVKSGRLRGFAVSTATRSPLAPAIPTVAEAGLPGYQIANWYGFWAPKGTPADIVAKLAAATAAAFAEPEVVERIRALGAEPATSTPQAFGAFAASEMKKWGQIAVDAGAEKE